MKISVVTATIRPEGLGMVQSCLRCQTFQDFEWLICCPEPLLSQIAVSLPGKQIVLMADPPKEDFDFYRLNGAWNLMISQAKGDLILFVCDWTWFDTDALQRMWSHYERDPNVGVTSIGGQYRRVAGGVPVDKWEDDPRPKLLAATQGSQSKEPWDRDCEGLRPVLIELAFASMDRRKVIEVGGFDEQYDQCAANSEKELAMRLYANGYRFLMDTSLEVKNWTHERMADADCRSVHFKNAQYLLFQHQREILGENPTRLTIPWSYGE